MTAATVAIEVPHGIEDTYSCRRRRHELRRAFEDPARENRRLRSEDRRSPSRALSATFDFNPDLILLDLMMPGTDGAAVATQLKKDERFQGIPVIFLTSAVTHQEVAAQGGVIGGKYFLAKPVTVQELVVSIEKHLKK
jgi:cyclic di-GMP phosphodiesterase